ncbi:Cation/multidrug efflux pump [Nitrospira japonica]|uniref:Cation/multidrug efflux pump n=1 Tax=Nitrospira japonica TaxID=1325564 RepID=A0A1W1I6T4_9BACT|nr:hypothetical protein [Nitrospira japonica]SLM48710.1 Cation/multidrug efflux pump [Nitrospira japonica]
MDSTLTVVAIGFGVLGLAFLWTAVAAVRRRRFLRFSLHSGVALACLAAGLLLLTIHLSLQGYQALTREDLAATIRAESTGPEEFLVTMRFPDGRLETYALGGNEIYVDAHILKWKSWANLIGLHTAYELDRISGRYHDIADERAKPRTIYALSSDRLIDVFTLRRRYAWLAPLVDAEYGSAAFIPARDQATYELRISTTGLLFRSPATDHK